MAPMADVALLVSGEWLKGKMAADDVTGLVIVDVSWSPTKDCLQEYKNCHIPGAHYLNVLNAEHTSRYPRNLPAEAVFTEMAQNIGINSTSHVVVYSNTDNAGYFMSGRGWWTLKYFGHPNVSILDGGLQKWTTLGYPLSSDVTPDTTAGEFSAIGGHMYRSFEELSDNLESHEFQVCDARPPGQFSGNTENTGHIPGAKNLPMGKVVDNNTGLLKSTEELHNLFLSTGIDLSQPVVTSCNRGMTACTVAFAAAVCGADNVAVYRGSFTEWSQRYINLNK